MKLKHSEIKTLHEALSRITSDFPIEEDDMEYEKVQLINKLERHFNEDEFDLVFSINEREKLLYSLVHYVAYKVESHDNVEGLQSLLERFTQPVLERDDEELAFMLYDSITDLHEAYPDTMFLYFEDLLEKLLEVYPYLTSDNEDGWEDDEWEDDD